MDQYSIVHTTTDDLEFIYWLFDEAIAYQKRKSYPVWNGYDKDVLQKDIENKLQYKIISGKDITCIFSVCYDDPFVWREKDNADAIYLHRIVVNPKYKGQKQFGKILQWAMDHARKKNLQFIRMDTWADNPTIVSYYQSFGFQFFADYTTPDTPALPKQQRNIHIALLEYDVN